LQAAINAVHSDAVLPERTDWPQILELYDRLMELSATPVIALNRAVAVSFAEGPERALPLLEALDGQLADYAPFHAARADLQRRLGDVAAARSAYARALELTANPGERAFLERRRAELAR
jgi:RNA polymerase sigma-70 factor (ECF subfamily)